MNDQASELRQLVRQEARLAASPSGKQPNLVAVVGGRRGVGATTLAVNLAVALAAQRRRTVLVDADLGAADASMLCRLEQRDSLAEVISAGRTVREILQSGPGGIHVVPGVWAPRALPDDSHPAAQRLLDGLRGLASQADAVVADAGSGSSPLARGLWRAAELVLAVTTPELPAVMDAYAAVKAFTAEDLLVPVHLVVNRAGSEAEAEDVHGRIARTCLRFLAVPVTRAGHVPEDPAVAAAGNARRVFVTASPDGPAARQVRRLASYVASSLLPRNRRGAAPAGRASQPDKKTGRCVLPVGRGSCPVLDGPGGPSYADDGQGGAFDG